MTLSPDNANRIKLKLLRQFYGLEEFMDLEEPLPEMLNVLDNSASDFCFISDLSNLDLWFIQIGNVDDDELWSPFNEPLSAYAERYDFLTAHIYAEKQWPNEQILKYVGLSE